jgi:cbb3-type cytochrome oxidase subunit 3
MDTVNFVLFLLVPIAVFVGALVWAYGRKRKARFEEDGNIPFQK